MKSTGIVRRVDDLGRIVIPKEIRKYLNIREGEALELFIENNKLIFTKYNNGEEISRNCTKWVNDHKQEIISVSFLGRETMCAFQVNGTIKRGYVTYDLRDNFDINVAICYCAKQVGFQIEGI